MTLLNFIEKNPKQIMMEEMLERLETEPDRQWAYFENQNNATECKGST